MRDFIEDDEISVFSIKQFPYGTTDRCIKLQCKKSQLNGAEIKTISDHTEAILKVWIILHILLGAHIILWATTSHELDMLY